MLNLFHQMSTYKFDIRLEVWNKAWADRQEQNSGGWWNCKKKFMIRYETWWKTGSACWLGVGFEPAAFDANPMLCRWSTEYWNSAACWFTLGLSFKGRHSGTSSAHRFTKCFTLDALPVSWAHLKEPSKRDSLGCCDAFRLQITLSKAVAS